MPKKRMPLLTPEIEPVVYNYVRTKAIGLDATVFALNGTEDHVYMAASIPAKIAVATFVGQVKGVASARFNQEYGATRCYIGKMDTAHLALTASVCLTSFVMSSGKKSIIGISQSFPYWSGRKGRGNGRSPANRQKVT
jgi:hypothetical protein